MNRREFSRFLIGTGLAQALPAASGNAQTTPSSGAFRFSVMVWTLEKQASFDRCLEIVAAAGYQGIELVNEFKKWSADDTRRINAKMRSSGLIFDAMSGGSFRLADPAAAGSLIDQLTQRISVAKDLGCSQLLLTSGPRVADLSPEAERAAMIDNLKRVADLMSKNNFQMVIEPIDLMEDPRVYMTSVTDGFEIARAVGSPSLKVLYDFYHEQRGAGNLTEKLEKNIELVGLVHIADVPGRHQPGTGEIDYMNIYKALAKLKYNKFIAMEFYPIGDAIETLKTARLAAEQAERNAFVS